MKKPILTKLGNMTKMAIWRKNGDLTQNRQRFNENSWKKAILAKMANTVKTMI